MKQGISQPVGVNPELMALLTQTTSGRLERIDRLVRQTLTASAATSEAVLCQIWLF